MVALDWKPRSLPNKMVNKEGKWLVIVPEVPNWVVTNFAGTLLICLCDGNSSINELIGLFSRMKNRDCTEEVTNFFEELQRIKFFDQFSTIDSTTVPSLVYLNVTNKCNMRCPYCYMSSDSYYPAKDMDYYQLKEIIKEIYKLNPEAHLVISGGEPLIRDDIFKIIAYSSQLGLSSTLITNGSLISRENVKHLKNLYRVQVSLDGSSPDIHEKTRMNFTGVWNGIQLLVENNIRTVVSPTINSFNYADIPILTNKCRQAGIEISYCLVEPVGRASENHNLTVSPREVYDLFTNLNKEELPGGLKINDLDFASQYSRHHKSKNCGMGKGTISIASNGDVFPCHTLHRAELKMGNLRESSLKNILRSEIVDKVRVDVDEIEGCKECHYRYLCGNGCRSHAYWKHGTFRHKYGFCELSYSCIEHNLLQGL